MTGIGAELPFLAEGFRPGSDRSILATAYVLGYDAATRLVTVSATADGEGTQVPAIVDAQWSRAATCTVLRDPSTGATVCALAPVQYPAEAAPADLPPARGQVTAVSGSTITITTTDGKSRQGLALASYTSPAVGDQVWLSWAPDAAQFAVVSRVGTLPSAPGAPTGLVASRDGGVAFLAWNPVAGATGYQVRRLASGTYSSPVGAASPASYPIAQGQTIRIEVRAVNAAGASAWASSGDITWDTPPAPPPSVVEAVANLWPTDTGTWSARVGRWDRWNTSQYGGASTLYQGNEHGSGPLTGAAFYGDQVGALGALAIASIEVLLRGAGLSESTFPPVSVQGITNGSRPGGAPTSAGGPIVSGSPGQSGTAWVTLDPSTYEAWRVGAIRGLALVGTGYAAVRGKSAADGMQMRVTYLRAG